MTSISLLDLPGEIRNKIYDQLLVVPALSTPRLLGKPPIYPQILSTCRKVYEEARQILYGRNTFTAHPSLLSGLPRLGLYKKISAPNLISMIRRYHICIRLDCDPNFSTEKTTKAFTGVEELTVEVFQAQYGSSDYKVLKLFEGVRGVKRVNIYGSVTLFPEYVEWLKTAMMAPKDGTVGEFEKEKPAATDGKSYDIWIHGGR